MCIFCNNGNAANEYADHYAEFYVHVLAEKEGLERAPAIREALKAAGTAVNAAETFCIAYKAAYEREYETMRKKFWDFFNDWAACNDGMEKGNSVCGYHAESLGYHYDYHRHEDDPDWDKETGYESEEDKREREEFLKELWDIEDDAERDAFREAHEAKKTEEEQLADWNKCKRRERCSYPRCKVKEATEKMHGITCRSLQIPSACPPPPLAPFEVQGAVTIWKPFLSK